MNKRSYLVFREKNRFCIHGADYISARNFVEWCSKQPRNVEVYILENVTHAHNVRDMLQCYGTLDVEFKRVLKNVFS